jgi:cell division protein ZapB
MNEQLFNRETERNFSALEEHLNELARMCSQLISENKALQAQHMTLLAERETLIDENRQTRARIDAMVARLKGLEKTHE